MFIEMHENVQFKSQVSQDMIAYLYFKGKKNGFYMDVGAHNGVYLNNTYVFEQLGWQGVCIEPQPDIFLQLQKNRKCDLYNVALSSHSDENVPFIKVKGTEIWHDMLSGLAAEMPRNEKKNIKSKGLQMEYIKVKMVTFDDIMKNYPDRNYIDFLSIDTEGVEMVILETIDFTKYHFGLLAIENNEPGNILENYMKAKGYKVFMDIGQDMFFVKDE
jgi:FkbM family methyltransferase